MNYKKTIMGLLMMGVLCSLSVDAHAADDTFFSGDDTVYYPSTAYEDIYRARYNYGGTNAVNLQLPELPYGVQSSVQAGIMEKTYLHGLAVTPVSSGAYYNLGDTGMTIIPSVDNSITYPIYTIPAFTSIAGMERADGSIGTVSIPTLGISMKVWEGETNSSMAKGLGHYSCTSGWDGNVGVCGHNRGAIYVIGSIKDLNAGDRITYTTVYGTRTYRVTTVAIISNTDWSYLQATADNRITLTTCLADHPESRVCVQAVEV